MPIPKFIGRTWIKDFKILWPFLLVPAMAIIVSPIAMAFRKDVESDVIVYDYTSSIKLGMTMDEVDYMVGRSSLDVKANSHHIWGYECNDGQVFIVFNEDNIVSDIRIGDIHK